jgi:prevent-host-death family protein
VGIAQSRDRSRLSFLQNIHISYIIYVSWSSRRGETMVSMTSAAAQNSFGKLLDTVQREAVTITRHGRPTAFVVSPQDMEELLDSRRKRSRAVADLEAWRTQAAKHTSAKQSAAAATLTGQDVDRMVHKK